MTFQALAYHESLQTELYFPVQGSHEALPARDGWQRVENRRVDADQNVDFALVRCIVQREQDAFAEFYDRYAARVFGLLIKLLNNHSDAEKVLQETFWQVWKTADKYNQARSSPYVWLILMARSRAIDHLRRRRKVCEEPSTTLDCSCNEISPEIE